MSRQYPPCSCGKPIHDGAHLCPACVGQVKHDLLEIARRWDPMIRALTSSEGGITERPGKQTHGAISVGTNLNEAIVNARRKCTEVLWFALQVIREDCDDLGRPFTAPDFRAGDEAHIAVWLAAWQIPHLTATTAQETALEIAADLGQAEQATHRALNPTRWVSVAPCDSTGTNDLGERTRCEGWYRMRLGQTVAQDLVCSEDGSHRIDAQTWNHAGYIKRRLLSRPLDENAARNLALKIWA